MLAPTRLHLRTSGPTFTAQPSSHSMQAAVITGPGKARLESVEIPEPKADEVLVKLEGCGVSACAPPYLNSTRSLDYPLPPGYPGREGWGWVTAIGSNVHNVAVGDRVTMLSNNGYAEYDIAPSNAVFKLPPFLDSIPFPSFSLASAINIFRRSRISPRDTVAIVGIGVMGALLTSLAVAADAQVIAISRREFALDLAGRLGATHALSLTRDRRQSVKVVEDFTDGKRCQVVFEAVGQQETLNLATELTALGGQLIIAGYHDNGLRQINLRMWNRRGLTVINAHTHDPQVEREGLRLAIEATCQNRLDPSPICTHIFGLAEVGNALEMLRQRPPGFLKGLILF